MKVTVSHRPQVFEHQADATLSQSNPVSGTKYVVLATTKNVRIIDVSISITWATTQPTPLEVHITIDGIDYGASFNNPVSGTTYSLFASSGVDKLGLTSPAYTAYRGGHLLEGRSVKIEAEITWATTQPTPLVCRVKYAKIP